MDIIIHGNYFAPYVKKNEIKKISLVDFIYEL